jgi:hypothetical protein
MKIIKEKEELESRIEFYKKVYRCEIIDYYEALLNLEVSSVNRDLIHDDILEELRQTEFYKDLSRYNIFTHASNVLSNPELKRLYTGREKIEVITPTNIKDYKVYSYNPEKDSITLYDLVIDQDSRLEKISEIKKDRLDIIDLKIKEIEKDMIDYKSKFNEEPFDLKFEKDQLEQSRYIAELEIKSLKERSNEDKESYANEVINQMEGIKNTFTEFYNIDSKQKILKVGNTKLTNYTYNY